MKKKLSTTAQLTKENFWITSEMERVFTTTKMETSILEIGKTINSMDKEFTFFPRETDMKAHSKTEKKKDMENISTRMETNTKVSGWKIKNTEEECTDIC